MITLEVCANSVPSALAAQAGGAVRVELCNNLHEGGTTPSAGQITLARQLLQLQLYVLIRPRGGDFLYTDTEMSMMLADIDFCIQAGCDGIVIGALNADASINMDANSRLMEKAVKAGLGVTFHRAFDMTADIYQALEDVIELGCERILTSGGKTTAMEGASTLNHLVHKAAGRISIMPGGGISEQNITDLIRFTGVTEAHASARSYRNSAMQYHNPHIVMGGHAGVNEYKIDETDSGRVMELIRLANVQGR